MPRLNLAVNAIKALPTPETGKRTYIDSRTAGLGIMVLETGSKMFFWQRKVRGRRTWKTLGAFPDLTIENARARAAEKNIKLADWKSRGFQGANPLEEIDEKTLGEVLEDYVDKHVKETAKNPKKSCKEVRRQLEKYAEAFRDRRLSDIIHEDIQKRHREVGKKHGPYTANRLIDLMHALFEHAGHSPNPAHGIDEFDETPRERILEPEELQRLLPALDARKGSDIYDFVRLLLFTGVRSGDLYSMRWENINFPALLWTVPDPKSHKAYDVPLVPEAVEILESRKSTNPWVFPGHRHGRHLTNLKRPWKALLTEAKIQDFRIHDFRHTYVSYMVSANVSSFIASKALGHASTAMVEKVYARLTSHAPVRDAALRATRLMLAAGENKS